MATSARLDELKRKFDENPRRYFAPLANEYRKLGDLPQAIALCRAHLPNQPGHVSGHIVLAQSLYEAHELGEAREVFVTALDLDPENLIALRHLGDIAREQGDPALARTWYARVLDADPRNEEIAQLLKTVEATPVIAAEAVSEPMVEAAASPAMWVPASPIATVHEDFPEPVEILGDLPEPPASELQPVLEPTTTDETILVTSPAPISDDFFADEPPAQVLGELEAVAEPSSDDWFSISLPPAQVASADEAELGAASELDDSFFPDLSEATPTTTPAISAELGEFAESEVPQSEVPTPPYVAPFPESLATASTPSFLSAIDAEPASADWSTLSTEPEGEAIAATHADGTEPSFELETGAVDAPDAEPVAPVEALESSETLLGYTEASLHEGVPEGFMVEYGQFVPPAEDDTLFIANTIAVPLDESDPYSAGAPELSAHEPFAIESAFTPQEPGAPLPPIAEAVEAVEGLVPREVQASMDAEPLAEIAAADAGPEPAPFVTETMAELYLQQGFHDEALAIYRQLLAQSPDDHALHDRVSALERGATSAVVEGIAPRDSVDRHGQSVRSFFAHFARREPRRRADRRMSDDDSEDNHRAPDRGAVDVGAYAGVATREEALTVPDEPLGPPSLTQLFAAGEVSRADENAATTLASAFDRGSEGTLPTRSGERELSLEHLFRNVPARSSGAVTLDEFYQGSSPGTSAPDARGAEAGEEHDADIEQFTAWLEGLKKK